MRKKHVDENKYENGGQQIGRGLRDKVFVRKLVNNPGFENQFGYTHRDGGKNEQKKKTFHKNKDSTEEGGTIFCLLLVSSA